MKATTILNRLLTHVTPNMHKVRRKSVNAMVTSLMSGAHLSVTSLGRHITSQTTEKHQIKRSTAPLWKVMNEQVRNNRFFTSAAHFRQEIDHFFQDTLPNMEQNLDRTINDNFQLLKPAL